MFREYIEKGKSWMDKIASAVMNYTELENKVREATSDEPWGPHGKILNDLARETYDYEGLLEIMTMLLNRIFPDNPCNWRRTYKGLIVLAHLLRYGSERVSDVARDHLFNLRSLETFQCIDERGRDLGASVRIKAHEVVELLQDAEFLQAERQKAFSNQKNYDGIGNNNAFGYGYSGNYGIPNDYKDDRDNDGTYHFPSRSQPKAEMPWHSRENSETSHRSPHRLGSFESWQDGRERSIADDVADKFSEVLRAAKSVTNDFLGRPRVPPPSVYEEDPHKVSEEVFKFPDARVDNLGDEDSKYHISEPVSPFTNRLPSQQAVASAKSEVPAPGRLVDLGEPQRITMAKNPSALPRPPSVELISSSPKNGHHGENDDLFAELDSRQTGLPANKAEDLFADFGTANVPGRADAEPAISTTYCAGDADFGDFSSFSAATTAAPVSVNTSLPANNSVDPFFANFASPLTPHATMTPATTSAVPLQPQPLLTSTRSSNPQEQLRPKQGDVKSSESASKECNLGKTWSDLGAFDLNLDLRSDKAGPAKPLAPSLSQLQSLQRHQNTTQEAAHKQTFAGAPATTRPPSIQMAENSQDFAIFN
uniref:ENTH domain-containing protein n=1 Tax=Mesocestoides corti TaxID=53468 RepID=A0A5K3FH44_MESCO